MKFLKKIFVLLITLVGLVLIIALFVKKDFKVSRSIEINRVASDVFDCIRYLKNQESFSVWQSKDPNVEISYSGAEDGTEGAIYKWDSAVEDVGAGEQEIIKIDENERIEFELRFTRPMEMTRQAFFTTEYLGGSPEQKTRITWGFEGSSPWPWNIFFLFRDMDNELGPELQEGLNNLKKVLESKD